MQTEIADQETRKQNLLTEKTALAAAHQAALESEAVWRRRHEQECHQKDDEVEALRKEFQKLQAARLSAAERLDVQQKHNSKTLIQYVNHALLHLHLLRNFTAEKEASNAEMRRVLRQKATDLAGHQASLAGIETEIAQLQQSVDQVRTDLAESRQNVVHATKSKHCSIAY